MKKIIFTVVSVSVCTCSIFTACSTSSTTKTSTSPELQPPLPEKVQFAAISWKPNISADELNLTPLDVYRKITVTLKAFDDIRADQRIIGKTLEDKKIQGSFIPLATRNHVAKWCKEGIINSLKDMNVPYADKKGSLQLELELAECEIEDNITQTGKISFNVSAYTGGDLLIWEGKISGNSDLYYRPKDSDGISECLSNAVKITTNNLFTEQSFRDAVIKAFELE